MATCDVRELANEVSSFVSPGFGGAPLWATCQLGLSRSFQELKILRLLL